MFSLQLMVNIS